MQRIPVRSSSIRSAGYEKSSATLEVEFNHGAVYQYFDVPMEHYDALVTATSPGYYFESVIRVGGFRYHRRS